VFYISNRAGGQAELFDDNGIPWHGVYSDCQSMIRGLNGRGCDNGSYTERIDLCMYIGIKNTVIHERLQFLAEWPLRHPWLTHRLQK
jgi:hypothetical protein